MSDSVFNKPPDLGYSEAAVQTNFAEFKKVIESRRSIRVYTQEQIPADIMKECLRLALLAPNSSNLQPWQFYWVRNPQKKADLVKACLSQPAARTAAELIVCVARTDTWQIVRQQMLALIEKDPAPPPSLRDYYKKLVPIVSYIPQSKSA